MASGVPRFGSSAMATLAMEHTAAAAPANTRSLLPLLLSSLTSFFNSKLVFSLEALMRTRPLLAVVEGSLAMVEGELGRKEAAIVTEAISATLVCCCCSKLSETLSEVYCVYLAIKKKLKEEKWKEEQIVPGCFLADTKRHHPFPYPMKFPYPNGLLPRVAFYLPKRLWNSRLLKSDNAKMKWKVPKG